MARGGFGLVSSEIGPNPQFPPLFWAGRDWGTERGAVLGQRPCYAAAGNFGPEFIVSADWIFRKGARRLGLPRRRVPIESRTADRIRPERPWEGGTRVVFRAGKFALGINSPTRAGRKAGRTRWPADIEIKKGKQPKKPAGFRLVNRVGGGPSIAGAFYALLPDPGAPPEEKIQDPWDQGRCGGQAAVVSARPECLKGMPARSEIAVRTVLGRLCGLPESPRGPYMGAVE